MVVRALNQTATPHLSFFRSDLRQRPSGGDPSGGRRGCCPAWLLPRRREAARLAAEEAERAAAAARAKLVEAKAKVAAVLTRQS